MKTRYHIIKSYSELEKLVEACLKTGYASVDFETNAEPIYNDTFKPTILSVTFQPGSGISIPLQHFECSESHINKTWLEWLTYFGRNVIENPNVVKIAWNWKFDNQIFQRYNIYSRGTVIDGMLAKYLLNEERPNGLKDMVRRFLPEFSDYEKYDSFDSIPWSKKPLKKLCEYGCMDTDFTFRLSIFFESFLIKKGFYNLYRNLIMPASKVLQSAEKNGLPFDVELNVKLREKYNNLINEYNTKLRSIRTVQRYQNYIIKKRKEDYIETLESEIEELREEGKDRQVKTREQKLSRIIAGEYTTKAELKLIEEVNFSSQKQMVDLLYNSNHGFKFPVIAYTVDKHKKPTNNPSTAEDTLIKLKEHDKSGFILFWI